MKEFDYQQDYKQTDCRKNPELYRVGRGEQGVLMVEPYKGEILPHWRFKTVAIAEESSKEIMALFEKYRTDDDFVGMDMARKFIQMGYTRARRYANHKGGKKYDADGEVLPYELNEEKAAAAAVFKACWDQIRADKDYLARKKKHQAAFG
ncbi:DUF4385 domain-containing protein [Erwinia sorbitola]|uniref:DUF4385 family protein n=1 Tax=Erwinia sorbitola TaxID=2681984 RepID=A0A6I6ELR8_9GAMM|nr:DUF4385 domain-containing protein [Erwinia sorbitola]QGU87591.1 DUF4385 family protein [Erwinia sorbitola]